MDILLERRQAVYKVEELKCSGEKEGSVHKSVSFP
jgi:hypothetical protein